MIRARLLAAAVLVAATPVATTSVAASVTPPIGVNAGIRNVVKQKSTDQAALHPAVLRDTVHIGDQVESGPNSALQMLLRDESVFTVGANARVTIDRFVYDPARSDGQVAASVAKGAFRFMSGKALHANPGQVAIKTPVASIGVRGTVVEVMVGPEALSIVQNQPALGAGLMGADPNTASLVVLRGPGPNRVGLDKVGAITVSAGGHDVDVTHPGYVVVPGPGQAPLGPFPLPPTVSGALDESLRTMPSTDGQRADAAKLLAQMQAADQAKSDAAFTAALARIVLRTGLDPVALQDALGALAATLDPKSPRYTTVETISHLLASSSGAPATGVLGQALGSSDGITLIAAIPEGTDFTKGVSSLGDATGSTSPLSGFGSAGGIALTDIGAAGADHGTVGPRADPMPGVPEPASWATMLTGFALAGLSLRRRQPLLTA